MHFLNGAQFLNATLVFSFPPSAVMSPVTKIYASEFSQKLDLMTLLSNLKVALSLVPSP